MIYKLEGKGYAEEPASVEFELIGDKVCISFETNESSGMFTNVDAVDFNNLLCNLQPNHLPNAKQLWIKPISEAIQEILGGYNLIVAFRDGLDELTYNSVALEIIELMEAFMVTGKVPEPGYTDKKEIE